MDEVEVSPEELSLGERVYEVGGKWFMRVDKKCNGVELPHDIARLIHGAIQAQIRADAGYVWLKVALEKINCHKTVLYALGLLRSTDRAKPTYGIRLINNEQYVDFQPRESARIREYVAGNLKGKLGVIQIVSKGSVYVGHTFLAGVDELGRVVCFEKAGFSFPFRITLLEGIWRSEGLCSFAAAPLEEFKLGTERARNIREEVEARNRG